MKCQEIKFKDPDKVSEVFDGLNDEEKAELVVHCLPWEAVRDLLQRGHFRRGPEVDFLRNPQLELRLFRGENNSVSIPVLETIQVEKNPHFMDFFC